MNNKIILGVIVLVLVAVGITYWQTSRQDKAVPTQTVEEKTEKIEVEKFSLNGKITKIDGDKIFLQAGDSQKVILISEKTEKPKDLKIGSEIIVYTPDSPFKLFELKAVKIVMK